MQKLFSIMPRKDREFSVIGIANVSNKTVSFQALLNGIPYLEGSDYNEVRDLVIHAVEINTPADKESLS